MIVRVHPHHHNVNNKNNDHLALASSLLQAAADGDLLYIQDYLDINNDKANYSSNANDDNVRRRRRLRYEELPLIVCASGCTVLHWAAGMNQVHIVRFLLNLSVPITTTNVDQDRNKFDDEPTTRTETKPKTKSQLSLFHVDMAILSKYKASGRTPLHYAIRNGCYDTTKCLLEEYNANLNVTAKHGVLPIHLGFFQNQLSILQYLWDNYARNINILQTNDYQCNVLHWLAICPKSRAGPNDGINLIPTAKWLCTILQNVNTVGIENQQSNSKETATNVVDLVFRAKQTQGHTALHKAAWLGHTALIQYLHEHHDMWDDEIDDSGNYAVSLAEMAQNTTTVHYLRTVCSRSASNSYTILGLSPSSMTTTATNKADNLSQIRQAYHRMARRYHPDRMNQHRQNDKGPNETINTATTNNVTFHDIYTAYHHLMYENGRGLQCNESHQLKILLPPSSSSGNNQTINENSTTTLTNDDHDDCFKARLLIVLKEYGTKGLDISNLKKKWKQIWNSDFPFDSSIRAVTTNDAATIVAEYSVTTNFMQREQQQQCKKSKLKSLTQYIQQNAGDVVDICMVKEQCYRIYPKKIPK